MNDLYKTTRHTGRSLLLLGVFLAIAGPTLMFLLTFAAKILITPWYAPLLGTLAYTGPVKYGQPFPTFATTVADGSTFTQTDLQGNQHTVTVFFRGHW